MGFKVKVTGSVRFRICPDCGEAHDRHAWPDNHRRPDEVLATPSVIADTMPAIQGQHDGKMYDSKRALRASYRPSGNKEGKYYVEVGNDPARHRPFKRHPPDKKGIRTSIEKAQAKLARGEVSRETYERKVITRPGPI